MAKQLLTECYGFEVPTNIGDQTKIQHRNTAKTGGDLCRVRAINSREVQEKMARVGGRIKDERSRELQSDLEAQLDELGTDPAQVGTSSAGQSASSQGLSSEAEATGDSVEDLADTDQGTEAAAIEGVEDAADHPERPAHTHKEHGHPDDVPRKRGRDEAA